ncbi:uncharacterized protein [Aegilops tauschii subsp. strangulata]
MAYAIDVEKNTVKSISLSLNAVSGAEAGETIRPRALVGNQVMLALIDSGSSHRFVDENFAKRAALPMLPAPSVQVALANGQQMQSQHKVKSVQWWTQGNSSDTSMRILQLGAYDAVLGMDWLKCHSPMTCDWNEKTIQFLHKDQPVTLQGSRAPCQVSLEARSVEQLDKALAGNDVWALAIADLSKISSDTTAPQPAKLTQLLEDFQDVVEQPTGLPPHRAYNHALSLEPGHGPPNSRPYHYSPQQKDEIECQSSISYLGHIISSEGVATDPKKMRAMEEWPQPTTVTELRGFLGLTGYYRKFVKNYGIITKPLTQLLTKKGFLWSDQAAQAFEELKRAMSSTPVLALPDYSKPFAIETDASDSGIGAVLSQNDHPIAYLSQALGVVNKKLSVYEKEFLAVQFRQVLK